MPKQIKKREHTKSEKAGAALAIAAMILGLFFAAALIAFIPELETDSRSIQLTKAVILACGYCLFVLLAAASGVFSMFAYRRSHLIGDMIRGFFSFLSAFLALLCIRFMLAMFFSGLDKNDLVDKVVGDNSYAQFIKDQGASFACLIIGLSMMLIIGIISIVKLAKR